MAERPRGRRQTAGGSGGRGRGRPRGRRGRQVNFGTGDGAGCAGRQEGDGVRRESGDGAERRVTVASRIDGEHGGGSATTQRRVRFTDRVDDSSEKVATATIADASKKKDTAKTEAADSTTTSTGVGAARMGDGEESNEWSTRSGDADSDDGRRAREAGGDRLRHRGDGGWRQGVRRPECRRATKEGGGAVGSVRGCDRAPDAGHA
ncbi:hypothetical protein PF003_g1187 [Phytophthora fragariae]|nr:hypothetical protein PF003_g1187 [Phytophthora fragariae]